MHIEGPKWKPPAPKPELKKAKTGGLIDAIKKAAEKGVAAQAKSLGKELAQAAKQAAADADQTHKPTGSISKLGLAPVGGKLQIATDENSGVGSTLAIGYRTRNAASGSGEFI